MLGRGSWVGVVWFLRILDGQSDMGLQAVTVYPLSKRPFRIPEQRQDGAAGDPLVTVAGGGGIEPADPNGARDRIGAHGPDTSGIVAVDGDAHGVGCG